MSAAVKCDEVARRYLDCLSADFAVAPSANGCYLGRVDISA